MVTSIKKASDLRNGMMKQPVWPSVSNTYELFMTKTMRLNGDKGLEYQLPSIYKVRKLKSEGAQALVDGSLY